MNTDALSHFEEYAREVHRLSPPMQKLLPFSERHPQEDEWIKTSTFDFALKMRGVLKEWGSLTEGQLAAVQKCMKYEKSILDRQPPALEIDLTKVPSGYYAVPGGLTRLKVRIKRGTERWQGHIFVSDGAAYGQARQYGSQKPGRTYEGQISYELAQIANDPQAASAAYGRLTGTCGVCGRHLEDARSVERGIGPVCAEKMGWV